VIKQPWLAWLSLVLWIILVGAVGERLYFLHRSEKTVGSVSQVSAHESRCGGGKRSRRYACTKFRALVKYFSSEGASYFLDLSAGSSRGRARPISAADRFQGQAVHVVYDRTNPVRAYEDTFWGVWNWIIILFGAQLGTLGVSFLEPKGASARYKSNFSSRNY
jgi:hypothetical protein